ncbi:nitroreductase family deazaflavin-dependent oxidoreductase [Nocardia sienata]|uniref:nitroreductase family deazaflavin-dependent oxidoreductase n=1 Tax=Nocardia sienata TaxID=248552 RepID=UPI0007A4E446|nr:nitroreductase family deazaflavin-dependent oxidoreductase [Nocardia sienata]
MADDNRVQIPRWLKPMNQLMVAVGRVGVSLPVTLLTVPGRTSGKPRTTPVTPFEFNGAEYVLGGIPGADWVKNVQAAETVELKTKRKTRTVRLVEVPAVESEPVLREFPRLVPTGVPVMIKSGVVTGDDPDEFAALAGRCVLFRIENI